MSNFSNFMWQLMWLFFIVSALQPILQQRMLGAARQRTILRFEMPSALLPSALGNAIIVVVTHHFAYPLRGVGIALPLFVAPLAAAAVAIILGRSMRLPRGAHVAAYGRASSAH